MTEEHPLGTGGGIANVAAKLRHDTVMVFNGDVLSGADLGQLLDSTASTEADVTLAPGAGGRPAGVRLCAHRRRRPSHRLSGEDRRTRRPTRSTPAATSSNAHIIDRIPARP